MAEDYEALTLMMENVMRLVGDATYLIEGDRIPSAFVLNVIAMEEVGKVILMRWRQLGRDVTTQKRTAHLQKQWAVACVLVADKMLPYLKRIILGNPGDTLPAMMQLAEDFMDSREKQFFEGVIAKNLDHAKQLGLYQDHIAPGGRRDRSVIDNEAVKHVSDALGQAVPLLTCDLTLILASVFYEMMPPHQTAILSEASPSPFEW